MKSDIIPHKIEQYIEAKSRESGVQLRVMHDRLKDNILIGASHNGIAHVQTLLTRWEMEDWRYTELVVKRVQEAINAVSYSALDKYSEEYDQIMRAVEMYKDLGASPTTKKLGRSACHAGCGC